MGNNLYEITIYSSCANLDLGIYYYTTYDNRTIIGIDMNKEDLNGSELINYDLIKNKEFYIQN